MPNVPTLADLGMRHNPAERGFHAQYREHEINHCPGCGRTHWLIGRVTAECAFCALALPLSDSQRAAPPIIHHKNRGATRPWDI